MNREVIRKNQEKLSRCVVRLVCENANGDISIGTGSYCYLFSSNGKCHLSIITNWHVVEDALHTTFTVTTMRETDALFGTDTVRISHYKTKRPWLKHPDDRVDLCCVLIQDLFISLEKSNNYKILRETIDYQNDKYLDDYLNGMGAVEDILMVGYPNGIWDSVNNRPIFRNGITATHFLFDYNGNREFLIDTAVFGGSSGSPVFLYRHRDFSQEFPVLLGILYAGMIDTAEGDIEFIEIPTSTKPIALTSITNGLGVVIKTECIKGLEKCVADYIHLNSANRSE